MASAIGSWGGIFGGRLSRDRAQELGLSLRWNTNMAELKQKYCMIRANSDVDLETIGLFVEAALRTVVELY